MALPKHELSCLAQVARGITRVGQTIGKRWRARSVTKTARFNETERSHGKQHADAEVEYVNVAQTCSNNVRHVESRLGLANLASGAYTIDAEPLEWRRSRRRKMRAMTSLSGSAT
eukprot:14654965-Alexandrium_andersonii.AAC.1